MDRPALGYWKARGRAQVARHLLFYCGTQWEEKSYTDPDEWFKKDKNELGLPLANLPYLITGQFKVTESYAIYRYIAKHYGHRQLLGKTAEEEALVDSLMGSIYDIDHELVSLCWNPEGKQKLSHALKIVQPKLIQISDFYGQKQFSLGYLTLVDFLISEFSYYLQKMAPEIYERLGVFGKVRKSVEDLKEMKEYYSKQDTVKGPFVETGFFAF